MNDSSDKALFLDVDGVLNNATTLQRHRGYIGIDPYMAFLVGRIVESTGARVVLSSSWRHMQEGVDEVRKQVVQFSDMTPTISTEGRCRGDEIAAWLKEHPEIKRYAILDDDSDMLDEQLPNFFKTSWYTGITDKIAENVITHLNESY